MALRRKKLIEVALPLEAISEESSRRKRKAPAGYPTTFHKWWAQRPLAACRSVLFASLVDDPDADPAYRRADGSVDEDAAGLKRAQLFNLIEELIKWENTNNDRVIHAARAEIARCVASRLIELGTLAKDTIVFGDGVGKLHPNGPLSGEFRTAWELVIHGHGDLNALRQGRVRLCPPEVVSAFLAAHAPPILDPFAGGGSIPLEAQRLGLRVIASDLNPVAVLINKALVELPARFANRAPVNPTWHRKSRQEQAARSWCGAQGLAEDVRHYGAWVADEARKRLAHLFPTVHIDESIARGRSDLKPYIGKTLPVVAWIWSRTVAAIDPAVAGAHVPLVGSFWLSTKRGKEVWVRPHVNRERNEFSFTVEIGKPPTDFDPRKGTVMRSGATCLLTDTPIPFEHIRAEGKLGRIGHRLMAIVVDGRSRIYVNPLDEHVRAAAMAAPEWYPETNIPEQALGFRVQLYGMNQHYKLFTARQLQTFDTVCQVIQDAKARVTSDALQAGHKDVDDESGIDLGGNGAIAYGEAIAAYLAAGLSRAVDYNSAVATWRPKDNAMRSTFSKQAMPMVWDYAEGNPFAKSSAGFAECVKVVAKALEFVRGEGDAEVSQLDASAAISSASQAITCTDPPYYSNIGYSDLSDYFYVWLRRALSSVLPNLFSTVLTPKNSELIASPYRHDGRMRDAKEFFEAGLRSAFTDIRQRAQREFPTTVFYAFKQSETNGADGATAEQGMASTGWETMLSAFMAAGFVITGTWPMRTEGDNRSVGIGANALASSVVLVGNPRPDDAPLATRREFMTLLKRELPVALKNLQRGTIAPVDLAQAAIGPGMSVFSRFSKVVEADGTSMTVRAALTLINEVLDEVLAEQEGEFDGDTRWAVSWFETHGVQEGPYGVAETLSKAKNTSVQGLVEAGVITARGGKVKLLARDEMPDDWDPITDTRSTCWEATQHLIRRLQHEGEQAAAELLTRLGSDYGERARDLAYRLYNICERKGWAQEALAYNSLVIAWSEISKLSRSVKEVKPTQTDLF
jgi:putative DNA methylase